MPGKTGIEEEFGIDLDVQDPDLGKAIAASIRTEQKQALFYSEMEGVLHNHDIIHFFRFLSKEKKIQKEILEKAKKDLESGSDWPHVEYDYTDLENAFQNLDKLREKKLRMDAGDADTVSRAAEGEEQVWRFYERLADALRGGGNDFFRALSEREERHHELLIAILDMLKQAGIEQKDQE